MRRARDKLFKLEDLPGILDREGHKLVMAHGCFDLLHAGHVMHLEEARSFGDVLVVTVTSDDFVNKGPNRPAFPQDQRALLVAALECVDFVAISNHRLAAAAINAIKPDVYVKGRDYAVSGNRSLATERAEVEAYGGQLKFTKSVKLSSTETLRKVMGELIFSG